MTLFAGLFAAMALLVVNCQDEDEQEYYRVITIHDDSQLLKLHGVGAAATFDVPVTAKMLKASRKPYVVVDGQAGDTTGLPASLPFDCSLYDSANMEVWRDGGSAHAVNQLLRTYGYAGQDLIYQQFDEAGKYSVVYLNDTSATNTIIDATIQLVYRYKGTDSLP